MARQSRLIVPHQPHLIVQRGIDKLAVFRDDDDHLRFLGWLRESARLYKVAIHAYALLPDRLLLLATPTDDKGLAAMMQKAGRHYVPWYNARYERAGSLFQGRFRTALVDAPGHLLACSRYVELEPVRAGLAFAALDHPWSSYAHHAGVKPDLLLTDHALYWSLGNTPFQREAAYTGLIEQGIAADELATIDTALAKGWPVASHAFKAELERRTQRRILPAKRGRPFKAVPVAPVDVDR